MSEYGSNPETGQFDQQRYDRLFMGAAKALITDPLSKVVEHPYEVPSDREVIASEFVRPLTRDQVAGLAGGRYVMSADLRYVTPTKRNEGERQEVSEVAITMTTYESSITQVQSYAIALTEDIDLGVGMYEPSVVTELAQGGERVSYSGVASSDDLDALQGEDYLEEVGRLVADRMQGHRMMTADELEAFAKIVSGYQQSRPIS